MAEKCKITFTFESDKKADAEIFCKYEDGKSIKGNGPELIGLCKTFVEDLVENPLSSNRKLTKVNVNK